MPVALRSSHDKDENPKTPRVVPVVGMLGDDVMPADEVVGRARSKDRIQELAEEAFRDLLKVSRRPSRRGRVLDRYVFSLVSSSHLSPRSFLI